MLVAINKIKERIYIDDAISREEYFCPFCEEKLILKKGNIRAHHFSHKADSNCSYHEYNDMSFWHLDWQERFPKETREVVLNNGKSKCIADILLEEQKIVIEFQHSKISSEVFNRRNKFYISMGYKVIWLFDLTEDYDNERLYETNRKNVYKWNNPRNALDYYYIDNQIEVYFQLQLDKTQYEGMKEAIYNKENGKPLSEFEEYIFNRYENEESYIGKVSWISESGFDCFAIREEYMLETFLDKFGVIEKKETKLTVADLYDELMSCQHLNHTDFLFYCPLSTSHYAISTTIDFTESLHKKFKPCERCEYHHYNGEKFYCKKRINDLGLNSNSLVLDYKRSSWGQIYEIKYFDEEEKTVNLSLIEPIGESIYEMWNKDKPSRAIYKNIKRNYYVRIIKSPYGTKFYGYISNDGSDYFGSSKEIFYSNNKEWVCIWKK